MAAQGATPATTDTSVVMAKAPTARPLNKIAVPTAATTAAPKPIADALAIKCPAHTTASTTKATTARQTAPPPMATTHGLPAPVDVILQGTVVAVPTAPTTKQDSNTVRPQAFTLAQPNA